jgi:hypothetical protein
MPTPMPIRSTGRRSRSRVGSPEGGRSATGWSRATDCYRWWTPTSGSRRWRRSAGTPAIRG